MLSEAMLSEALQETPDTMREKLQAFRDFDPDAYRHHGGVHRRLRDQTDGAVHPLGADVTSAPGVDSGRGGIGRLVASRALAQQTGRTPPGEKER